MFVFSGPEVVERYHALLSATHVDVTLKSIAAHHHFYIFDTQTYLNGQHSFELHGVRTESHALSRYLLASSSQELDNAPSTDHHRA